MARIPQGIQKYTEEKCLYCSSFVCFSTLFHASNGGIHKLLGILIFLVLSESHFELLLVRSDHSRNSLAVSSDSESELKLFITETQAVLGGGGGGTAIELSETAILNSRTEDLLNPTCLQLKKNPGEGALL